MAALIGLLDEVVQYFLPNRVFDWYDVGLNTCAALIGALALAWWRWTSRILADRREGIHAA
jgi:VanZ family protein